MGDSLRKNAQQDTHFISFCICNKGKNPITSKPQLTQDIECRNTRRIELSNASCVWFIVVADLYPVWGVTRLSSNSFNQCGWENSKAWCWKSNGTGKVFEEKLFYYAVLYCDCDKEPNSWEDSGTINQTVKSVRVWDLRLSCKIGIYMRGKIWWKCFSYFFSIEVSGWYLERSRTTLQFPSTLRSSSNFSNHSRKSPKGSIFIYIISGVQNLSQCQMSASSSWDNALSLMKNWVLNLILVVKLF